MEHPPRNLQNSPLCHQIRNQCEKARRTHPSGAPGIDFEAAPGPVQFGGSSSEHLAVVGGGTPRDNN
eukprot:13320099-Alexandrium_andersonii.AAC.1